MSYLAAYASLGADKKKKEKTWTFGLDVLALLIMFAGCVCSIVEHLVFIYREVFLDFFVRAATGVCG